MNDRINKVKKATWIQSGQQTAWFFLIIRVSSARLFFSLSTWRFNSEIWPSFQISAAGSPLVSVSLPVDYTWAVYTQQKTEKERKKERKKSGASRPYHVSSRLIFIYLFLEEEKTRTYKMICDYLMPFSTSIDCRSSHGHIRAIKSV